MGFIDKIKKQLSGEDEFDPDKLEESYVEISGDESEVRSKIVLRPFILEDFSDIKLVLDALREGYTIPLINIRPLKDKDLVELKRAINKLKKTTDAINGDIAGFGDDWIAVTPNFASIHREMKEDTTDMNNY